MIYILINKNKNAYSQKVSPYSIGTTTLTKTCIIIISKAAFAITFTGSTKTFIIKSILSYGRPISLCFYLFYMLTNLK